MGTTLQPPLLTAPRPPPAIRISRRLLDIRRSTEKVVRSRWMRFLPAFFSETGRKRIRNLVSSVGTRPTSSRVSSPTSQYSAAAQKRARRSGSFASKQRATSREVIPLCIIRPAKPRPRTLQQGSAVSLQSPHRARTALSECDRFLGLRVSRRRRSRVPRRATCPRRARHHRTPGEGAQIATCAHAHKPAQEPALEDTPRTASGVSIYGRRSVPPCSAPSAESGAGEDGFGPLVLAGVAAPV